MLTITQKATEKLVETRQSAGAPDSYGVRLFVATPEAGGQPSLAMAFVATAEPGDQVMEQEGMTAYVAPDVAQALEDATIDVTAEDGAEQLVIKS